MGRIREFYSNEEEMKEMSEGESKTKSNSGAGTGPGTEGNDVTVVISNEEEKKEKKEEDVESVVVVKEDLNEVSKVESKPDSNKLTN